MRLFPLSIGITSIALIRHSEAKRRTKFTLAGAPPIEDLALSLVGAGHADHLVPSRKRLWRGSRVIGKWHTLGLAWDCQKKTCKLTVDGQQVADLPQLSKAVGICYLRMVCMAEDIDHAGLDVDWVKSSVKP